ncbi:MAG TPA: alkaline phosphatase family protein [Actinomycetota bacterium]|nr:alkaline phosphatase family protein [Actinomycetota bacterium]
MGRALAVGVVLVCLAATGAGPAPGQARAQGGSSLAEEVCASVSPLQLLRVARGTRLDRSGDVQYLPAEPDFVGAGLPHAGPWGYVQEVPLLWYGSGYVRPGVYRRPVTLADVAPTLGALLRFPFDAPDGRVLREALLPDRPLPRLVVTLVWDSAGRDVLDRWPGAWPTLRELAADGAWFERATVGSSPSNTPPSHATIGTGAFPDRHGFMDEFIRLAGRIEKPNENGPAFLLLPTLADLYDRARGNRPLVGVVATLSAHVMMMSHGALWGGGDRDLAVTRERGQAPTGGAEATRWNLTPAMAPFYRRPAYVNDVGGFTRDVRRLDQADGSLDGRWRDNDIAQLANGFDTPARTTYQTRLVEEVVRREGFGADPVPDLLFVNYKAIDTIGHMFSADSPEMLDALRVQDEELRRLVSFLDRQVGRGAWAMVVTADHGANRDPAVTGAFQIDIHELERRVEAAFDDGDAVPLVQDARPTQMWLDRGELADAGATPQDVAAFLSSLTKGEVATAKERPVPLGVADEPAFAAAFPSSILSTLPCLPDEGGSSS